MLSPYELFGFMSPELSARILAETHESDKVLYRATEAAVAEALKQRPVFFERKPRAQRHADILSMLTKPRMNTAAGTLICGWLMKKQTPLLADFLDSLGIPHKDGSVDDLPKTMDDARLKAAVDLVLGKYPADIVVLYLNAFYSMNDARWPILEDLLQNDPRLQLAG